jgi:nucleotide sugar dehydrogenase
MSAEETISSLLERREARWCVLGLGSIGSTLADALASSRIDVVGVDRDPEVVARYRAGSSRAPVSSDAAGALSESDVVVIAVRLTARTGGVDTEPLDAALPWLAGSPERPRLVLVASTVPVGTTRAFAAGLGGATYVAHVPERLAAEHDATALKAIPHLVGGVGDRATCLAKRAVAEYCDCPIPVGAPEVSELAKLLENAFRAVGIALVAEVTQMAHASGIEAADVTSAAATKPFGYFPFHPGPGVGGHCLPNDLELLRLSASRLGTSTSLFEAASAALACMPRTTVDRLEHLLHERGHGLADAEVLLVGTGFKPGSSEQRAGTVQPLVRELRRRGAAPSFLDVSNERLVVDELDTPRIDTEALEDRRFDAAVIVAGDPSVSLREVAGAASLVIDAGGVGVLATGPSVEVASL